MKESEVLSKNTYVIDKDDYPEYWKNYSLVDIIDVFDGVEYLEKWATIEGYEGMYEVSSMGRVKTLARRVIPPSGQWRDWPTAIKGNFKAKDGYIRIELSKDGVNRKYPVHVLVGKAFVVNVENKPQINHKFGRKADNRFHQLEWSTASENRIHALRVLGVKQNSPWKGVASHLHPMFGRTGSLAQNSKPVVCHENGTRYVSIRAAANSLKMPETIIKYLLTGKTKKSKYGYTFSYGD